MTTVRKESLSEEQFDQLLRFFQVFSNESRLKLIGHLAGGEKSVGELADVLNLKEPTVSHHLAELKGIGLVSARAEGTMRILSLIHICHAVYCYSLTFIAGPGCSYNCT